MATAQDIIDAATLMVGVRPQGTAYNSFDSSANTDAFTALQDLIAEYAADNKLHIPVPSATTDTLDLYEEQIRSLKYVHAGDLIDLFRVKDVSPKLTREIEDAKQNLEADNNINISVDMSDLPGTYRYDIERDSA